MANWKYKVDFSEFFHNDDYTLQEKADKIIRILKGKFKSKLDDMSENFDEELDNIIFGFKDVGEDEFDFDPFNNSMSCLYDWADQEVAPYGAWPRNKMMWVET